ncbi:MAG TPA: RNA polymerase sigma factor [Terriglobales bacterium]|jgi:RNA polymerase sigma-70 factor (ECF subfamily)
MKQNGTGPGLKQCVGEPVIFEALVREQGARVHRLCYALLSNRALAEEACQEVFLRAWRGLGDFRGDAKLSTWLYTIARHVCLNLRVRHSEPHSASLSERNVLAAVEGASVRVPAPERAGVDVMAHLQRLPPDHRAAVILFYLEEKPYEEAAAALGVPLGTFKTWLYRGKKELAARLGVEEVKR